MKTTSKHVKLPVEYTWVPCRKKEKKISKKAEKNLRFLSTYSRPCDFLRALIAVIQYLNQPRAAHLGPIEISYHLLYAILIAAIDDNRQEKQREKTGFQKEQTRNCFSASASISIFLLYVHANTRRR